MTADPAVAKTIDRLDRAVASGNLPADAEDLAGRISKRLSNPVRVTILGLPGSGKSSLLNFLAGAVAIPPDAELPSVLVSWGDSEKTECVLADGSKQSSDRIDMAEIAGLAPVFVRLEMPLPALKKIDLLEVAIGSSQTEQKRALAWAARSTDIALWCTGDFTPEESDLWNAMPNAVRDHSFLIVTKADKLKSQAEKDKHLSELQETVTYRFQNIFAIETLQAMAARGDDGSVDADRLADSGGQDLIRAILHAVEQGIQASLDGATILFARYEVVEPDMAAPKARVRKTTTAASKERISDKGDFNADALTYLTTRVGKLQDQLSESTALDTQIVMEQCLEDVDWLVEQLSERAVDDPQLFRTLDTCQDAADMMLLLQLEQQDSAVEDAVILLLQIKRDFEQKMAA